MIPKIIHYCWFGHGEMSPLAKKCIASWKEKLPDYEIKEWNESNFDLNLFPYTREAYEKRKFAFVADVVRLYALYSEGGIYMDTDVEVLKTYDPFLHHTAFSGYETDKVTTGIMASEKGGEWVKHNLDYYTDRHFILEDGSMDQTVNVVTIYKYMLELGFRGDNTFQDFPGIITIYPRDYFCPKSYYDGIIRLTDNTVVIHHFEGSWHSKADKFKYKFLKSLSRGILGKIKNLVKRMLGK